MPSRRWRITPSAHPPYAAPQIIRTVLREALLSRVKAEASLGSSIRLASFKASLHRFNLTSFLFQSPYLFSIPLNLHLLSPRSCIDLSLTEARGGHRKRQ